MTRWTALQTALPVGLGLLCTFTGCGSPSPSHEEAPDGATVYRQPLADGNSFTCATCHALTEPAPDGLRRPGHPIGTATKRSSWKNGKANTFLDAVNSCVTEWMVGTAWKSDDPQYVALYKYLDAQSMGAASDLTFAIASPPSDVSGGDSSRGRTLFNQSCVVCHGTDAVGTTRGPSIAHSKRMPEYIASRVRTSGSPQSAVYSGLTGGVMPFWAEDRLSDPELRDLIAFVTDSNSDGAVGGNAGAGGVSTAGAGGAGAAGGDGGSSGTSATGNGPVGGGNAAGAANGSGCTSNNPRIGWVADLGINTGEGEVSGTVTMIDDCTLELRDFSYDGNGIDVRVYGSKNQNFKPGFSMGSNLVGHTFTKQTLRVSLPAGKSLDDMDWVAIWCVDASANFGSGPFKAP